MIETKRLMKSPMLIIRKTTRKKMPNLGPNRAYSMASKSKVPNEEKNSVLNAYDMGLYSGRSIRADSATSENTMRFIR